MLVTDLDPEFFTKHCVDDQREIISEDISGKSTLLVTIGDSWTWGDGIDNRVNNVYGRRLSNMLNSDWINIAWPGTANNWIAN